MGQVTYWATRLWVADLPVAKLTITVYVVPAFVPVPGSNVGVEEAWKVWEEAPFVATGKFRPGSTVSY